MRPRLAAGLPFSQRMRMHLVANTSPMLAMNTAYAGTKRHAIPLGKESAVKAVPPCGYEIRDFAQKTNRLPHRKTQAPENASFFPIDWQGAAY